MAVVSVASTAAAAQEKPPGRAARERVAAQAANLASAVPGPECISRRYARASVRGGGILVADRVGVAATAAA